MPKIKFLASNKNWGLLHLCRVSCILIVILKDANGVRLKRSMPMLGDNVAIRTEYVDKNNSTILAMFNLTEAQINRIRQSNYANNEDHSAQGDSERFKGIKDYRINDIRNRLQSAFLASNSEENQEHPLHEMAAYPICSSESTDTSWLQDNNVTIRFSDSLFEPKRESLNLDSAILRLYKINPNGTDVAEEDNTGERHNRCTDTLTLSPQIRVTVSIMQQLRRNKRERKKHICNTIMMNISKTGWVEIDIKRAIYIWESVERRQQMSRQQSILVGWLMIEVHDEEENALKPGLFFKPPKCDQAELAIPWNYYGPHTSMSPFATHEVPRYPRLDVKLIGYASFAAKNLNKELQEKLRHNLRRQLHNLSKSTPEEADVDDQQTTIVTSIADSLTNPSNLTEIEEPHRAKKRQSNRNTLPLKRHHNHNHRRLVNGNDGQEQKSTTTQEEKNIQKSQQQTDYQHHHHHQHKRHHHHQQQQQQLHVQPSNYSSTAQTDTDS